MKRLCQCQWIQICHTGMYAMPKRSIVKQNKFIRSEVLDISVNGYRIKWTGTTPANLKTGEFILVQENAQSQWRGGVVRWIKQSTEKSLELGSRSTWHKICIHLLSPYSH